MLHSLNRMIIVVMAVWLVATPQDAMADGYEVSLGTTARHMHSTTVDAISADDRHAMFSMTIGARLDRRVLDGALQLELGYEAGSVAGTSFGRMHAEADLSTLTAGTRLRWDLGRNVFGFGRAALGFTRLAFELSDRYGASPTIADRGYAGVLDLGGGLDYQLFNTRHNGRSYSLAVRAELGYTAASPVTLSANPAQLMGEGVISIPTEPAELGTLNTSSWNFRIGVVGRF